MGTSQSSGGPGGGAPMVPPWTPPAPPPDSGTLTSPSGDGDGSDAAGGGSADGSSPPASNPASATAPSLTAPSKIASGSRFSGARRNLSDYSRSQDTKDLRRGLKNYVRSGYGGSGTLAQRHGGTAATAGALNSALSNVASGQPATPGSSLDPALLAGRSADEVMDAVVEAVRPVDGSQDAEAERASIRDALSDLLGQFPDADLLNLDADQRSFAIEAFTANDVIHRFELDLGKTIIEKASSAASALSLTRQAREYIKQAVAASFRALKTAGRAFTSTNVSRIVHEALKATFDVFEGYNE